MEKSAADRRQLGRRTSDWLMPIIMWVIAFSAVLAARHYYILSQDLAVMNDSLEQRVLLLEKGQRNPIKVPGTSAPKRPK